MPDLTQITSPSGVKFTVAKDAADAFTGFLSDLEKTGYKINQGTSGGYNPRNIAGTNTPSQHSFGLAIDINSDRNPQGAKGNSDLPPNVADLAAAHGLTWGGGWSGDTRDPMHFEVSGKPVADAAAPSTDDLLTRMQKLAPAAAPQGAAGPSAVPAASAPAQGDEPSSDDLLSRMRAIAPPQQSSTQPPASGYVKNIGAGMLEGSAGAINFMSDPIGNLLKMPLTAGITAYQAIAPLVGGKRLSDQDVNDLLSDYGTQPGTRLVENAGSVLPGSGPSAPSQVMAATPGQQYVRSGVAGLAAGAELGAAAPNMLAAGAVSGTGAGLGGQALSDVAPNWLKPGAELAGQLIGGVAAPMAMKGIDIIGREGAGAIQKFAEGADKPATATDSSVPPPAPLSSGEAQPAGAQVTPPGVATITPAEDAAYRASAEGRKLMENQEIGMPDRNMYIPGETANAAEQEQRVEVARDLKAAGTESPGVTEDMKIAAQRNDQLRRGYVLDATGDEVSVHNETQAMNNDIKDAKAKVFDPGNIQGDVSMQPTIDFARDLMNKPINRQNSSLQRVFQGWIDRLTNPDGTAMTMGPEEAWGLRQDIDRSTSPLMQSEDPNPHMVAHQLSEMADVLDGGIDKAAPGYSDMLDTYKGHKQNIEAMQVLQTKMRPLLAQIGTPLRFSDYQRVMKNIVDMRRTPSTDLNPYKSISDDTMQKLWNVRDSLRRTASATELAKAPGSDTVPNIIDVLKRYGTQAGMHGVANLISPGWGSIALKAVQDVTAPARAASAAARQRAAAQQLIYPPNQLIQPDAAP